MIGEWLDIGWVDEIPVRGSRTVQVAGGDDIAVFRTAEGKVFALLDRCPHKHGRLSQGIVHGGAVARSEEHTSELQSLMRISYAVFCLKKKITHYHTQHTHYLITQRFYIKTKNNSTHN